MTGGDDLGRALRLVCNNHKNAVRTYRADILGSLHPSQRLAIIVPARDEAHRIGACIHALAEQETSVRADAFVVLVANNCQDETVFNARAAAQTAGLTLCVLDLEFRAGGNVGLARSIGFSVALAIQPSMSAVMTTDADCVVARNWIAANQRHLRRADAVCGRATPHPEEMTTLQRLCSRNGALEYEYRQTSLEFESLVYPDVFNPWPHHGQAPGASLGFRPEAYRASGGFRQMTCSEDRNIIRRLKAAGHSVVHADDVEVIVSCRLSGRARGGMADNLARRMADPDTWVDEMLSPARTLVERAYYTVRNGTRFQLSAPSRSGSRMRPSELPLEIKKLNLANDILRTTAPDRRASVLSQLLHYGQQAPLQMGAALGANINSCDAPVNGGYAKPVILQRKV